jgi:hypothetical protein
MLVYLQVKRFKKLLEKADNNKSRSYKLPADSIEKLHPSYFAGILPFFWCISGLLFSIENF